MSADKKMNKQTSIQFSYPRLSAFIRG